jgi:hypothetical protein
MNPKEKIAEIGSARWGGLPYADQKSTLIKLYELIDWFFEKVKNEYLGRSEASVLKSLKQDKPPKAFIEILLDYEQRTKNRARVVKALETFK